MLSIIQAFPEKFLPLFTYDGEIKVEDVLEILHIEEDILQDTLTLELLTMYINQLCQAGTYPTLRVTRANIQKIASIEYTVTYCHLVNPRGAEGYCSCLVQNWMGARITAWYEPLTLNVPCHYAPLGKLYNLNVQIVSPLPQSKV